MCVGARYVKFQGVNTLLLLSDGSRAAQIYRVRVRWEKCGRPFVYVGKKVEASVPKEYILVQTMPVLVLFISNAIS
jgi:hypothetical protein